MSILDQILAEALKEHPLQRKVIQYPAPEQKRSSIRSMLAADSMDGMRFRYWFSRLKERDLDQWRAEVDRQMLETKPK